MLTDTRNVIRSLFSISLGWVAWENKAHFRERLVDHRAGKWPLCRGSVSLSCTHETGATYHSAWVPVFHHKWLCRILPRLWWRTSKKGK